MSDSPDSSSEEERVDNSSDSDHSEANSDGIPAVLPNGDREIRPYRFEPELEVAAAAEGELQEDEDAGFLDDREDIERRLGNRDW